MHRKLLGKNPDTVVSALAVIITLAVLGTTVFRAFFGAELTDEAYSVAEQYLVAQGGIPFVNNWSQMPGFAILLAPFVKLFLLIAGGTEGVFLFFRLLQIALLVLTALLLFLLAKRYFSKPLVCLAYVLPILAVRNGGFCLRGDKLAILMIAVGEFLFAAMFIDAARGKRYAIAAGFIMALSVMVYPAFVVSYFFLLLAGVLYERRSEKRVTKTLLYLAGSVLAAVLCIAWLVYQSSLAELLQGLEHLLSDVVYFQLKTDTFINLYTYAAMLVRELLRLCKYTGLSLVLLLAADLLKAIAAPQAGASVWVFQREGDRLSHFTVDLKQCRKAVLLAFVCGVTLDILYAVYANRKDLSLLTRNVTTILLLMAPVFLCFVKRGRKLCDLLFVFVWISGEFSKFFVGLRAYGSLYHRNTLLEGPAYLTILFASLAIQDTLVDDRRPDTQTARDLQPLLRKAVPLLFSAVVCGSFLLSAFGYMYRENSFFSLTQRIPSGPYKGIYTTAERRDFLLKTERYVREYTSAGDTLLVHDTAPFVYLMTDAKPCTPSTWDMSLASMGYDEQDLYYDYFAMTGQEPTKIIYLFFGTRRAMSIDTDLSFNDYVHDHYTLRYEDRDFFTWSYKKESWLKEYWPGGNDIHCGFLVFDRVPA